MVVVSHLFLFYGKISGADVTWYESHLPLFGTIYFPIAPFSVHEKLWTIMKEKNRQKLFVKCAILLLKRVIRRGLQSMKSKEEKSNPIYPEGLKTGDQVCIIDPANAFTEEALDAAASHLELSLIHI